MTKRELEHRLREFYAARAPSSDTAPDVLRAAVLDVPHSGRAGTIAERLAHAARPRWRIHQVIAGIAIAALLVLAGGVLVSRLVGTTPTPTPTPNPDPTPILPEAAGTLAGGTTYRVSSFDDPFSFTPPLRVPDAFTPPGARPWGTGALRIGSGCCWDMFVLDDVEVSADVCNPRGEKLSDIPATPEEVHAWLASSPALSSINPSELVVDGRVALRFDMPDLPDCPSARGGWALQPRFFFVMRLYAVPTGDDTILVAMWGDPGSWEGASGLRNTGDEWVASFDFND